MGELQVNLDNAIKKFIPNAIEKAMNDGIQLIENDAKRKCPVDDGTLRASITHQTEQEENCVLGYIGSNVEYAPYVHEGTGLYAKDGHGRKNVPWTYQTADGKFYSTKGQQPQPFLQGAIDENKKDFLKRFEGIL